MRGVSSFFVKKFLGLDKGFNTPLSSCADKRNCYSDFAEKGFKPAPAGAKSPAPARRKFCKTFWEWHRKLVFANDTPVKTVQEHESQFDEV